jgi:hypothetical protein
VPVGVDHAGHHDAALGIDLLGALGHLEVGPDGLDPVADDEDVGLVEHGARVVHGQDRAAAEHQGPAGLRRRSVGSSVGRAHCWASSTSSSRIGRLSVHRSVVSAATLL